MSKSPLKNEDLSALTPREIVAELDRYIVGQKSAKRAVAVALRNRWRRQQVPAELRDEITPKNIIMIGPTGVGKTEIARRLARLSKAPFVKVEASKFTEVGYVGRDVESMIRDLMELAVKLVEKEALEQVQKEAREQAEEHILNLLMAGENQGGPHVHNMFGSGTRKGEPNEKRSPREDSGPREKMRKMLKEGKLNARSVEIETTKKPGPQVQIFQQNSGMQNTGMNLQDLLGGLMSSKNKRRKLKVSEALKVLTAEKALHLVDPDDITQEALSRTEQSGIVFLDEIDKIAGRESRGPDVSRAGVQRDLLPIIEGSTVKTRYGMVKTDHILFIAAGAFHVSKPSDLIPELQGRFPIRVELDSLGKEDFVRILTEPQNSLVRQYTALLATEDIHLTFKTSGIRAIAKMACQANDNLQNIGARRLYTVMEHLFEDLSFEAPDRQNKHFVVDASFVEKKLSDLVANEDLSRYIL